MNPALALAQNRDTLLAQMHEMDRENELDVTFDESETAALRNEWATPRRTPELALEAIRNVMERPEVKLLAEFAEKTLI